jgi:hypothetical protein
MELRLEKEQERIRFTSKGIILRVLSRLGMVGVAAAVAVGVGGFSAKLVAVLAIAGAIVWAHLMFRHR